MDTQKTEKRQLAGWKPFFRTIKNLRLPWVWIIFGLALNLILNNLTLKIPDMTADLLSGNLTGAALTSAVLYYVIYGLMNCVAVAGQIQAQSYSVRRARMTVWKKMLGMKMEYFEEHDPSDLMSAITNDLGDAVLQFVNVIIYLFPTIYYVVLAFKRINEYHWILALSCFAIIPLKYLYAWIMGRRYQSGTAQVFEKIGGLTGFLADRINHLPLIKTYTNEEKEGQAGQDAAHKLLKANMKLVHLDNISMGANSVFGILQKFIVVVVAVVLLQKGAIDMAMWLAFFLFSQNLFTYVDQMFDIWLQVKYLQGSFDRTIEIMEGADETTKGTADFPMKGDIVFKNVTFTYPETDAPALKNVSFTIPRGSSAAIVGLCGSGKTTSISMLERFYTPQQGQVCIGDTPVQDISLGDFRSHLAYVQQGASVFSGTIREAVTYGINREVTDEEIYAAAEQTGFREYLDLCPKGLATEVAADGVSMSGGQSQRLVLTREVLRGGDIILMDEPTSALDVRVSVKIQQTMDTLFADKTRILITHDLKFAKDYDKILVMSGGELVGEGTHETLMETCEMYRKMNENTEEETGV